MAHSTNTANYNLSQFAGTDKPAWLVDYNADMLAIDTNLKSVSDTASGASTAITSIQVDLDNVEVTANSAESKSTAALSNITEAYDATSTYSIGDKVLYNNLLYKCIVPISTAESFDGTKWERVSLDDVVNDKQNKTDNSLTTTNKTIVGAINELDSDMSNVSETFFQNSLDSYQWIKAHYNPKTKLVVVDVCRFIAVANNTTIGILNAHRPANDQVAYCMLRNSDGTTQFGNFSIDPTGAIKIHALTTNTDVAGVAHFEFPANS